MLLAIGLGLIVVYKVGVGEGTADFIAEVTGDPELALPPSVLDNDADPPDAAPPSPPDAAPPVPPDAAPRALAPPDAAPD